MDPLSVVASIAGLLGAAAKIYNLLEYISSAKNSPASIRDAQTEVKHVELALRSLQRYLWRLDLISIHRKELISIDELIVTLADAMVTISDFERFLQPLAKLNPVQLSISWARYYKQIEEHTFKAQRHKASLTMILNILQCESDIEASQSQERLQLLVEQILTENNDLRTRMSRLEDFLDGRSAFSRRIENNCTVKLISDDSDGDDSGSTIRGSGPKSTVTNAERGVFHFAFEPILDQTQVYRRNKTNECDLSFISSAQQSRSWSIFSGYSLADISVLSVIAMPITRLNVVNGRYYDPNTSERIEKLKKCIQQRLDSEGKIPEKSANSSSNSFKDVDFPHLTEDVSLPRLTLDLDDHPLWPFGDESLPIQIHPDFLTDSNSSGLLNNEVGDTEENKNLKTHDSSQRVGKKDIVVEELIQCKLCSKLLKEGKAFEFAGIHWHLNCFRCNTCGFFLLPQEQADVLLLGDGSVICNSCSYDYCAKARRSKTKLSVLIFKSRVSPVFDGVIAKGISRAGHKLAHVQVATTVFVATSSSLSGDCLIRITLLPGVVKILNLGLHTLR